MLLCYECIDHNEISLLLYDKCTDSRRWNKTFVGVAWYGTKRCGDSWNSTNAKKNLFKVQTSLELLESLEKRRLAPSINARYEKRSWSGV